MSELSTNITIQFKAQEIDEPFELVLDDDDQSGSAPVQVEYSQLALTTTAWGQVNAAFTRPEPLKVIQPGKKRIKLFCSEKVAATARLIVDGGTVTRIGRRTQQIIETLAWSRETRKRLKYFHDSPDVEVIEQTPFRDLAGNIVAPPRYNRSLGEFYAPQKVIGALVVRFDTGFSLFEITYDNGQSVASKAQFVEMQNAWKSGNIETAEVPPVRVIALSDWHGVQGAFKRRFWPPGAPNLTYRVSASGDDDQHRSEDNFSEVSGSRKTATEKIFHEDAPDTFIEVKKTIYLEASDATTGRTLKLRLLNNGSV